MPRVAHRFEFLRVREDDILVVAIDFGAEGSPWESTAEWSQDLQTWAPLPGVDAFPVGTRGVHEVEVPGTQQVKAGASTFIFDKGFTIKQD